MHLQPLPEAIGVPILVESVYMTVHCTCMVTNCILNHRGTGAGRLVGDATVEAAVLKHLNAFASAQQQGRAASLALVETAGGPGSPGPSGRLQVDFTCLQRFKLKQMKN